MPKKLNLSDVLASKGKKQWVQIHVDTAAEAAAAAEAGISIICCEGGPLLKDIRKAAPFAFIQAGAAHDAVISEDDALRDGFATLKNGADVVYCSRSARIIEAMAREGIPVTGHVGLVPNLAAWTGFRAVGRDPQEAVKVFRKLKDIENAGAACCEVEVVPIQLAERMTQSTPMITMGMGCGTACDTQYLFSCDVLGTNTGHYPRHSKRYADFAKLEEELHLKRVAAFDAFIKDVTSGGYPEPKHQIEMDAKSAKEFDRLAKGL